LRLLLVEDEPLVALDLEALAAAEGHQVVGVAEDRESALRLAHDTRPEAALIDFNLRDGVTGPDIGRTLRAWGIRIAFVTGNPELAPPELLSEVRLVDKPYTPDQIAAALQGLTTVA